MVLVIVGLFWFRGWTRAQAALLPTRSSLNANPTPAQFAARSTPSAGCCWDTSPESTTSESYFKNSREVRPTGRARWCARSAARLSGKLCFKSTTFLKIKIQHFLVVDRWRPNFAAHMGRFHGKVLQFLPKSSAVRKVKRKCDL